MTATVQYCLCLVVVPTAPLPVYSGVLASQRGCCWHRGFAKKATLLHPRPLLLPQVDHCQFSAVPGHPALLDAMETVASHGAVRFYGGAFLCTGQGLFVSPMLTAAFSNHASTLVSKTGLSRGARHPSTFDYGASASLGRTGLGSLASASHLPLI